MRNRATTEAFLRTLDKPFTEVVHPYVGYDYRSSRPWRVRARPPGPGLPGSGQRPADRPRPSGRRRRGPGRLRLPLVAARPLRPRPGVAGDLRDAAGPQPGARWRAPAHGA